VRWVLSSNKARTLDMTIEFVGNGFSGSGALPPMLAKRLYQILDDVRVAPPSERLDALVMAARRIAGEIVGPHYSKADASDRLQITADAFGLTETVGDDVILYNLAAGLANPLVPDDAISLEGPQQRDAGQEICRLDIAGCEREGDRTPPPALLRASAWQGIPVPQRRWLVPDRIPLPYVTMLSGDGAAGKTTITLQLCVATVRGTDWLGWPIDEPGPVIFFTAEEDSDEIHRRLAAIIEPQGIVFQELDDLHLLCMPGDDVVLGAPDNTGSIRQTELFASLVTAASQIRPSLIAIEAAADVFAGNENDRAQVRKFIAILRQLAIGSGAAVLLIAHPSLSGMMTGRGTSGSTAWNNSVRSRLYFASGKKNDDDREPDVRELRVMKANYGPEGEVMRLRWQRGLFVPATSPSTMQQAAAEAEAEDVFLRCLDEKRGQGIEVVHTPGHGYAPATFAKMKQASGYSSKVLAKAMERLLEFRRIRVDIVGGPPSKPKRAIVRAR
jgi:RecA-family ATPase